MEAAVSMQTLASVNGLCHKSLPAQQRGVLPKNPRRKVVLSETIGEEVAEGHESN